MPRPSRFSPEVRERAVRMVVEQTPAHDSQWAAIRSIAGTWVREHGRSAGQRPGPTTTELSRLKELEREHRELRRANEILRKASAYFAQAELDRRPS